MLTLSKYMILAISIIWSQNAFSQNKEVNFIELPTEFDTELEISGMVGHNNILYLVSEREEIVFLLNQEDYSLIKSIDLTKAIISFNSKNPENEINIRGIEMEGISWYNNSLYFVDEGNASIYKYKLKAGTISKITTNLDLSKFKGSLGMEGIAVNPAKKLIYILRERNGNNQSEIYTLSLSNDLFLSYDNQKYIINHPNNNWRYSDIYYDSEENIIYGLRSYYDRKDPEAAKCFIDKIPVNANGTINKPVEFSKDESLSEEVIKNRCTYVSNLEGLYKSKGKILIVSDNARGTKKCDHKTIKTMFVEYLIQE